MVDKEVQFGEEQGVFEKRGGGRVTGYVLKSLEGNFLAHEWMG